jgi:hypothetical protein
MLQLYANTFNSRYKKSGAYRLKGDDFYGCYTVQTLEVCLKLDPGCHHNEEKSYLTS